VKVRAPFEVPGTVSAEGAGAEGAEVRAAVEVPGAVSAAARPARHDDQRPGRDTSHPGSGAPTASAGTRHRLGALVTTGLTVGLLTLLAPDGSAPAQSRLGRLFSTPEQRAELDRLRMDSSAGEIAAPAPEPPPRASKSATTREAPALAATLNGVIIRGDGHRMAWIDGIETAAGGSTPAGIRVESESTPDGRLRIRLSLGRTTAVLAPGQSVDAHGEVRNGYERPATAGVAEIPGAGATHSNHEVPSTIAIASPPADSALPAERRGPEPPRVTPVLSVPSDQGAPGARNPGGGQSTATGPTGRGSAKR